MNPPNVVVVILTFNSARTIRECLDSLLALRAANVEIVVVDNQSTDATREIVQQNYPAVTLIANARNLGYAEGNNVGLRYALDRGAAFALVLNDDVVVAPEMLDELLAAADVHPNAALLGPLVYHHASPAMIQSAGGGQTRDWQFFHRGQNQRDEGQFRAVEPVGWLTGCAILARCDALARVGLFDTDYFMYWEDVDWCLRARRVGYRVLFVPQAKLWHKGVQVDYQPSPRVAYYSARNEFLLFRKHHAGGLATLRAFLRHARTVTSYTLRPRWRDRRLHRDALARALRDAVLRRVGATLAI
ncbi:MAG: glycosyltransferase family 2 protein [Chloroflexi bacterium]|nr:glycosyltransferase family 2 protein [Chloroflexota bacterium]